MTRRVALIAPLLGVLMLAGHASAQDAPKPAGPAKPKDGKTEVVGEVVRTTGGPKIEKVDVVQNVGPAFPNVRVEVTLTDQQTGAPTTNKTVMLTTSSRSWGRLRTQIESRLYGAAPLNIDARPIVTSDGRISLELTIEYSQGRNADAEGNTDRISVIRINQSLTASLESGKSLVVTQSADPVSDRKVTVEVKATIVK